MNSLKVPSPRQCIIDSKLVRPNWTLDSVRDPSLIWLDKNENSDPEMIKFIGDLLGKINKEALYTYPNLYPLYKKISVYVQTSMENLLITPGSDGVIRAVFETFINEGDLVLHTSPTFAMYPVYCKIFGANSHVINYVKTENGPAICIEELLKSIKDLKPKLFCLPNPDSPTGTVFTEEQIKLIIHESSLQNTLVLIDEAYYEFFRHTAKDLVEEYKNLVIARTFAKGWGLAGLRIGYAIACPEITQYLHKVRPMYEVNTFAVHFMEIMLSHEEEMQKSVNRLLEGKQYFKMCMEKMGYKTLNNHGNFQHVSFGANAEKIHSHLSKVVLYRAHFAEECLKDFSRFSITTKKVFSKIVNSIEECL